MSGLKYFAKINDNDAENATVINDNEKFQQI